MRTRRTYRLVQPYGTNVREQSTTVSEHGSVEKAFREFDRVAEQMYRTSGRADLIEIVILDADGNVVRRSVN